MKLFIIDRQEMHTTALLLSNKLIGNIMLTNLKPECKKIRLLSLLRKIVSSYLIRNIDEVKNLCLPVSEAVLVIINTCVIILMD
jgi:hypothetical protein